MRLRLRLLLLVLASSFRRRLSLIDENVLHLRHHASAPLPELIAALQRVEEQARLQQG